MGSDQTAPQDSRYRDVPYFNGGAHYTSEADIGSGNFLYVAYRELKKLEAQLLAKIHENFSDRSTAAIGMMSLLKTTQFYGIDIKLFAVELAKVTLMLAKKLALEEENQLLHMAQMNLPLELERALPLDNLDQNIRCDDALFCDWAKAYAIIGNPLFLGGKHMRLIVMSRTLALLDVICD